MKRIRDAALMRFDYTQENYTRLLWLFEGFTDYLAHIIMLRAGVTTDRDFYRMIAEDWPKYATRPGRNETPLDELSFEAWIKQYKPSENFVNRAVSYYEKGFWTGMALDLELRLATAGRRGLPEMFRWIWERFGRAGVPVDEQTVRDAAAAMAGAQARSLLRPLRARHRRAAAARAVAARRPEGRGARRMGRERQAARRSRPRARAPRPGVDRDRAAPGAHAGPQRRSRIRPPGAPGSRSTTTSSPSTARA